MEKVQIVVDPINFSLFIFKKSSFYKILGLQIISWDLDLGFRNKEKYFRAPGVHNLLLMRLILINRNYKLITFFVNCYLSINIIVVEIISIYIIPTGQYAP